MTIFIYLREKIKTPHLPPKTKRKAYLKTKTPNPQTNKQKKTNKNMNGSHPHLMRENRLHVLWFTFLTHMFGTLSAVFKHLVASYCFV